MTLPNLAIYPKIQALLPKFICRITPELKLAPISAPILRPMIKHFHFFFNTLIIAGHFYSRIYVYLNVGYLRKMNDIV